MLRQLSVPCAVLLMLGCVDSQPTAPQRTKTTDKIGEFDPGADNDVVKPEVKMTNPITGPLEAYQPLVQQIAAMGIDHAVNLFNASEGRYPNSYDEFMTRVIKENNIHLPAIPPGLEYQYDVENHKLLIIRSADTAAPK